MSRPWTKHVQARRLRSRDTGARMDALIRGGEWAQTGTIDVNRFEGVALTENKNPAGAGLS